MENVPVFYPQLSQRIKKKTARPATENVDSLRVDAIVVVHGLTGPQHSLAAEAFSPPPQSHTKGHFNTEILLLLSLYLHSQVGPRALKAQHDILFSLLYFIPFTAKFY